jgi:two-component system sensor histidine kinase HydH
LPHANFDLAPVSTLVVKDGRIVYANDALLKLTARRRDELLGAEFTICIAPEERTRLSDRYRRRLRGEPVPTEYESTVLAKTGARRSVRVTIAVSGDEVIAQFNDISDIVARRERLNALARLGVAIQAERGDESIFRLVRCELVSIGMSSVLLQRDGQQARIVDVGASAGILSTFEERFGATPVGTRGRWLRTLEVAWTDGGSFTDDAVYEISDFFGGHVGEMAREAAHRASLIRGGILRIDIGGQPSYLIVLLSDWLREEDMPALRLFAAQVSAALTAARIIGDLSQRNAELASLNRLAAAARTAPTLDALFSEGLGEIVRSFGCDGAVVFLVDHDTQSLVLRHSRGGEDEAARFFASVPHDAPGSQLWKVVRTAEPSIFTLQGYPEPVRTVLARLGAKVFASVPLMARSAVVGVMNITYNYEREISRAELELLQAMGSHFGAAVEAHGLLADLRERIDELTLVHEVGRALVDTLEIDQVLDSATRNLARTVDAPLAYLLLAEAATGELVVRAVYGSGAQALGERFPSDRDSSIAGWAFSSQEPVIVEDAESDTRLNPVILARTQGRAFLALPLFVHGRAIGVALAIETAKPRRFEQAEIERATAIANQIAVAVENARLYDDLRRSYSALARAQAQLVERERLAAIGELAAVVAHEVRNPLSVIFNSLVSLRRLIKLEGNAKMLLDIVNEESDRLNRIVSDLLDYARPVVLNLRKEPLARLIDDVVATALSANDGGIRLERDISADLPDVPMDARLLRQAMLNIAINAVQAMSHGGTLVVRARQQLSKDGALLLIEVGDTGPGIPRELRQRIFEPFFTTKSTGTGLGLAVVKRIIESHRGAISVRSEAGLGTTFTIRLPLEHNMAEGAQVHP